jgi:gliding motility-associated-like protein
MKIVLRIIFLFFVCSTDTLVAQYIQVDDTYSSQQLIQDILVNSPCANVTNFSVSGDTFSGSQQSFGYFNAGASTFPFSEGIVLTTGRATSAVGPNNSLLSQGGTSWPGDSELEMALGISNSINATALEFDFTPITNKISFDYIFSSEQYLLSATSSQCNFTDGFVFLLKPLDNSAPYQNLAIVPGTNIPVKINTVRGTGSICPPANQAFFDAFNGSEHPTNFNGQTIVMKAEADVVPGKTYHIKLVIADQGNNLYDSAIFLGGGSFKVIKNLGPNRLIATQNPICFGENYLLDATEPGNNSYKWFKNSVEIIGETNATYNVTQSGVYSVEVTVNASSCILRGEVTIEYSSLPVLTSPNVLVECDDNGDGITIFNLRKLDSTITMGNNMLSAVTYYANLNDAKNESNPILTPTAFQSMAGNQVIGRVTNQYGCANYAILNLEIANNTIASQTMTKCDINNTGFANFNLNLEVTPQIIIGLPLGMIVEYYTSKNDALLQINSLNTLFTNTIANQQTLFARLINGSECYGIIPVLLTVSSFNPPGFDDETLYLCGTEIKTLSVSSDFSSYLWNTGDTNNTISISSPGNYWVTVLNSDGCEKTKNFEVFASESATITNIDVTDFMGFENSIQVNFTGISNYVFSIDGYTFQNSSLFTNVSMGNYQIIIKDINGCPNTVSGVISVSDYPKFFTPNGDGINDYWQIQNFQNKSAASLLIFNRFGKIIKNITTSSLGWDGTFSGQFLPADDYWFCLELASNKIIRGHFALKR